MLWNGLGMDASKKHRKKKVTKEHKLKSHTVGDAFLQLDKDQAILTDADQNRRRRTLELTKTNNSWGFTLQTYGIRHKKSSEVEVMTYVDYVETDSSAWFAGLRRGDVILAVDGDSVDHLTHRQLVERLKGCQHTMRLIVLFEDCHRKVELHDRLIKLKTILKGKLQELRDLNERERRILNKLPEFSRLDALRMSACSSVSSAESSWDKYSVNYPPPCSASSQNNPSTSSVSDDPDALTDSLSMASSVYSSDGQASMEGSLVASLSEDNQENNPSETDSFTDSVFVSNNRSSVIFKPTFSVATADDAGEKQEFDGTTTSKGSNLGQSNSKTGVSAEMTSKTLHALSEVNLSKSSLTTVSSRSSLESSDASQSDQRNPLMSLPDQSEVDIQKLDINDSQSESKSVTDANFIDQSGRELQQEQTPITGVKSRADVRKNSSKSATKYLDVHVQRLSRSLRLSAAEFVNETDEITKL